MRRFNDFFRFRFEFRDERREINKIFFFLDTGGKLECNIRNNKNAIVTFCLHRDDS